MPETITWKITPVTRYKLERVERVDGPNSGSVTHQDFGEYWMEATAEKALQVFRDEEAAMRPLVTEPAGEATQRG